MARFLFWSDLHCEFSPFEIPKPVGDEGALPGAPSRDEVDGILIGGDSGPGSHNIEILLHAWNVWRVPVVSVPGNHEAWGATSFQRYIKYERELLDKAQKSGFDIDVLRCGVREVSGTRIIGATLWTDMQLRGPAGEIAAGTSQGMGDYSQILWEDPSGVRPLQVADTIKMHWQEFDFILGELDRAWSGQTLVLTHHSPLAEAMAPQFKNRPHPLDAAYFSDHWRRIGDKRFDAWLFGHAHGAQEVVMQGAFGELPFLTNMRGYPSEALPFDPYRIIDSAAPLPAYCDEPVDRYSPA